MIIIPAILEEKSEDAVQQINALRGFVPWIQIDVMDATMTAHKTCDLSEFQGHVDSLV